MAEVFSASVVHVNDEIALSDRLQIRALEWLLYQSDQYKLAAIQASVLARRFLGK
jgi:hypothetical protein